LIKNIEYLGQEKNNGQYLMTTTNAEDVNNNKVEASYNDIYFYSEVNRNSVLILNKEIKKMNIAIKNHHTVYPNHTMQEKIHLHIASYGGGILEAMASVDYIKNSVVPIISCIDGYAASAATILSVVANERYINEHGYVLVHQLSTGFWGKYFELGDKKENCDNFMKLIKSIYQRHTKIPAKELNKILSHDLWFDAKTALKYSIIDDIKTF